MPPKGTDPAEVLGLLVVVAVVVLGVLFYFERQETRRLTLLLQRQQQDAVMQKMDPWEALKVLGLPSGDRGYCPRYMMRPDGTIFIDGVVTAD